MNAAGSTDVAATTPMLPRKRTNGMLDASSDLRSEIRRSARRGVFGTWLRGRCFPEDASPRVEDFVAAGRAGRFHRAGQEALYFGRTLEAVLAECGPVEDGSRLWIQRFDLALPAVRVLEPPRWSAGALLRGAWASADERASHSEDYSLSHELADAARAAGVEAIVYPSDESPEDGLVNLVLFGGAAHAACGQAVGTPSPF